MVRREDSMTISVSRRGFLAALTTLASGVVARDLWAAAPPKESGLSSEGLLAGNPGFQPRTVMPLPHRELPGFLSQEQLAAHHAEYARAVDHLKVTEQALQQEQADAPRYAELRRTQLATANGVLLHEFYFGGLAPQPVAPPRHIESHMSEHMGPWESWRADFIRCALAAKAWALLVYDPYDDRWHNAVMDSDNDGVWVGANPLVVCDVGAHAFGTDYSRKEDYVTRFLDHVDWEVVSKRYKRVDRM
jgi:Fe-Mn family superoxide dismutase